ncbi:hypothetical protein ILYODFUR_025006 [Ilyodon furcidens]|uniref:Uncharacterized protein n=1 Tax=Ilyodon furcidens TaxID=33524 RepID=A0ABV0V5V9_9TELE
MVPGEKPAAQQQDQELKVNCRKMQGQWHTQVYTERESQVRLSMVSQISKLFTWSHSGGHSAVHPALFNCQSFLRPVSPNVSPLTP